MYLSGINTAKKKYLFVKLAYIFAAASDATIDPVQLKRCDEDSRVDLCVCGPARFCDISSSTDDEVSFGVANSRYHVEYLSSNWKLNVYAFDALDILCREMRCVFCRVQEFATELQKKLKEKQDALKLLNLEMAEDEIKKIIIKEYVAEGAESVQLSLQEKRIFLYEFLSVCLADGKYDTLEKFGVEAFAEANGVGIETIQEFNELICSYKSVYTKGLELINE